MTKEEKKARELTILRFHLASWERAKRVYDKLKNIEKVQEAQEKINYYNQEINK